MGMDSPRFGRRVRLRCLSGRLLVLNCLLLASCLDPQALQRLFDLGPSHRLIYSMIGGPREPEPDRPGEQMDAGEADLEMEDLEL